MMAHFCAVLDYPTRTWTPSKPSNSRKPSRPRRRPDRPAADQSAGRLLSQGLTCVLLGRPNAGKSSPAQRPGGP
ncbi:MAG: hypothetical protein ACLR53_09700 [Evtepia gabavorous]